MESLYLEEIVLPWKVCLMKTSILISCSMEMRCIQTKKNKVAVCEQQREIPTELFGFAFMFNSKFWDQHMQMQESK